MASWAYAVRGDHVEQLALAAATSGGDADFLWVHLDGRDDACLAWLHAQRDIPRAVIMALTAIETRPRSDELPDGAIVNLRGLGRDGEEEDDPLVSIRLWAQQRRVISLGYRTLAAIDELCAVMKRGQIRDGGDLIAALAQAITEGLDPDVAALGDSLDDCETSLDAARAYQMRRLIAQVRAKAIDYRRFVAPQRQALERLAMFEGEWLEDSDRLHLRDAADRFARMTEELEAVRERAALMHEQLTDLRSELLETRALIVSVVALVFLPLTFLTGLLGMNVDGIPYAEAPWAFWGVVGVSAVIALVVSAYFLRKQWFR